MRDYKQRAKWFRSTAGLLVWLLVLVDPSDFVAVVSLRSRYQQYNVIIMKMTKIIRRIKTQINWTDPSQACVDPTEQTQWTLKYHLYPAQFSILFFVWFYCCCLCLIQVNSRYISEYQKRWVRLNQLLWFGEEFTGYRWTVWLLSNDVWTYVNCKWITSWKHASYETVIETCYIGADLFKWHRDCIISAVLLCLTFYQAFWKSRILLSSVLCAAAVFIHISIMLKKFLSCLCTDC